MQATTKLMAIGAIALLAVEAYFYTDRSRVQPVLGSRSVKSLPRKSAPAQIIRSGNLLLGSDGAPTSLANPSSNSAPANPGTAAEVQNGVIPPKQTTSAPVGKYPPTYDVASSILPTTIWRTDSLLAQSPLPVTEMKIHDTTEARKSAPPAPDGRLSAPTNSDPIIRRDETRIPAGATYETVLPPLAAEPGSWVSFDLTGEVSDIPEASASVTINGVSFTLSRYGPLGSSVQSQMYIKGYGSPVWQPINLIVHATQSNNIYSLVTNGNPISFLPDISIQFFPETGTSKIYSRGKLLRDGVYYDSIKSGSNFSVTTHSSEAMITNLKVGLLKTP